MLVFLFLYCNTVVYGSEIQIQILYAEGTNTLYEVGQKTLYAGGTNTLCAGGTNTLYTGGQTNCVEGGQTAYVFGKPKYSWGELAWGRSPQPRRKAPCLGAKRPNPLQRS